jgi:hypothetical protein
MMKKSLLLMLMCVMLLGTASFVLAANVVTLPNPLCPGGAGSAGCIDSIPRLISQIATYISTIVGALAVIMFMWAGICFLLSGAMPSYLEHGKHALIWAIIGTAVALAGVGLIAVITAVIGNPPG